MKTYLPLREPDAQLRRFGESPDSDTGLGGGPLFASTSLGVITLLGLWFAVSSTQPELIFPSPLETWWSLKSLFSEGTLIVELARTLGRAGTALGVAFVVGGLWGALAGRSEFVAAVSQPALSALMAIPPVVMVALGLVWFGPGGAVTRLVVVLVALPLIVVSVQEAVRNIDADLLEMAASFQLSRLKILREVILPGITSPVLAAVTVTVGQALRVVVMAELLSSGDGVGAEISLSRTNLATADLFVGGVGLEAFYERQGWFEIGRHPGCLRLRRRHQGPGPDGSETRYPILT